MSPDPHKILVIKLGALGDFIQALGAMKAIRAHHPQSHITLLTTKPFAQIGKDCGYFDDVWVDKKPRWNKLFAWLELRRRFNHKHFSRVYDLQNNDRTGLYFKLFSPKPEWSGIAKGASHRNTSPDRSKGHSLLGHRQTLALAGISNIEVDMLEWMHAEFDLSSLAATFAVLVPGCSPQHPEKRWPADYYVELSSFMLDKGIQPIVIGTTVESDVTSYIAQKNDGILNLTGQTSLYDIAALARKATIIIGNDTGPMHLAAATGSPCVTLFCTQKSNPEKHGPMGQNVEKIKSDDLASISPDQVWTICQDLMKGPEKVS